MGARNTMLRAGKRQKSCPGARKAMLPGPCAPRQTREGPTAMGRV